MYPASLEKLIESFRLLPGVGAKSAERYALCMMDASEEDVEAFAKALLDIKSKLKVCPVCGNFNWTAIRQFNLMFETSRGTIGDDQSKIYLLGF